MDVNLHAGAPRQQQKPPLENGKKRCFYCPNQTSHEDWEKTALKVSGSAIVLQKDEVAALRAGGCSGSADFWHKGKTMHPPRAPIWCAKH